MISLEYCPLSMEKPTRGSAMGEQIFAEEMKNFGNQVNRDRVNKLMRKYQFYRVRTRHLKTVNRLNCQGPKKYQELTLFLDIRTP